MLACEGQQIDRFLDGVIDVAAAEMGGIRKTQDKIDHHQCGRSANAYLLRKALPGIDVKFAHLWDPP